MRLCPLICHHVNTFERYLLFKPNIGGSGIGIRIYYEPDELDKAVKERDLDFGIDYTALLQEYLFAKGGYIVRVEILNGDFLYAIRMPIVENSFNYCPADGCNVTGSNHSHPNLQIERHEPPKKVIKAIKMIMRISQADVGGVEYLVNAADSQVYYYDL